MGIKRTVKLLTKKQDFTTFHDFKKFCEDWQLKRKKIRFVIYVYKN